MSLCHYCGADHASDIICQRMFMSHASAFTRLNQPNPTRPSESNSESNNAAPQVHDIVADSGSVSKPAVAAPHSPGEKEEQAVKVAGYIMSDQYLYPSVRWDDARAMARWIIAARSAKPVIRPEAIEALRSYQQADHDGVMVLVSRQAVEEVLAGLASTASKEGQ